MGKEMKGLRMDYVIYGLYVKLYCIECNAVNSVGCGGDAATVAKQGTDWFGLFVWPAYGCQ